MILTVSDEFSMPQNLADDLWDYVDRFVCPIARIGRGDERQPPGDHHGTGWFINRHGKPHLCTCEHVANFEDCGSLGYAPFGGESGVSVGSRFDRLAHPLDFAIADVQQTWAIIQHYGECIPAKMIADAHDPVNGELLYVHGFPGEDAKPAFGQHNVKALGVLAHQVDPPAELWNEKPPFDRSRHICIGWNTAQAVPLTPNAGTLSSPGGISGSPIWNTRYREVTDAGRDWSVSDIRLTAIAWGVSSKTSVMVGTTIENFRRYAV